MFYVLTAGGVGIANMVEKLERKEHMGFENLCYHSWGLMLHCLAIIFNCSANINVGFFFNGYYLVIYVQISILGTTLWLSPDRNLVIWSTKASSLMVKSPFLALQFLKSRTLTIYTSLTAFAICIRDMQNSLWVVHVFNNHQRKNFCRGLIGQTVFLE